MKEKEIETVPFNMIPVAPMVNRQTRRSYEKEFKKMLKPFLQIEMEFMVFVFEMPDYKTTEYDAVYKHYLAEWNRICQLCVKNKLGRYCRIPQHYFEATYKPLEHHNSEEYVKIYRLFPSILDIGKLIA